MVLTWMLYATLVAGMVGMAALGAERAVRPFEVPIRKIWSGALAVSLLVPAAAWALAGSATGRGEGGAVVPGDLEVVVAPATASGSAVTLREAVIRALDGADGWALEAWAVAAGLLALLFLAAAVRLAAGRARWRSAEVEGEPVRVSRDVGPAVVGLLRPEVVVPAWVLDADEAASRWIVRHEREHIRARDPLRVTVSLAVAVLMPWNLALWWQLRRLRQAVEIDCDGRVLADADRGARRRYAELLLEVGRRRAAPWRRALAGFADTEGFLERRIRSMTEDHRTRSLRRGLLTGAAAGLLLVASCMVPGPDRPSSPTGPDVPLEAQEVPVDVSRPEPASEEELARAPTFTPYTIAPRLLNVEEVQAALKTEYPPALREAGVGGTVHLYFFITAEGEVRRVQTRRSSGHEALDEAARRVGRVMVFSPARNRDERVPIWISLPVTFRTHEEGGAPADGGSGSGGDSSPEGPAGEPASPDAPGSTPYTTPPRLRNVEEVRAAMDAEYPPVLREAGVGGRVIVRIFVDEDGRVAEARPDRGSGHAQLDEAALRVARAMRFVPARDGDEVVPAWIAVPVIFSAR